MKKTFWYLLFMVKAHCFLLNVVNLVIHFFFKIFQVIFFPTFGFTTAQVFIEVCVYM